MKKLVILIFITLLSSTVIAQDKIILYSFITNNNKIVQLIYNEIDKIFIFQLIGNRKIEIEVKDDLTDNITIFSVNGYHRGGGIQNAAMDYNDILFSYNGYEYDIYYVWCVNEEDENIENEPIYGIQVFKDGVEIENMVGVKNTKGDIYGYSFCDILPELVIEE